MAWEVEGTYEFGAWYRLLPREQAAAVEARIDLLVQEGPRLRRPMVGEIRGSENDPRMKELRVSAGDASLRVLFIFDPRRTAILLLGGDKAESAAWADWYRTAIPQADRLYREYLDELRKEGEL